MENEDNLPKSIKNLILSNRLLIKSIESNTLKKLQFSILNETKHILSYDRAFLWDISGKIPSIEGISGLVNIDENTELVKAWETIVSHLKEKNSPVELQKSMFPECKEEWKTVTGSSKTRYFWLPIRTQSELLMGMIVSFSKETFEEKKISEEIDIFMNFLMPGYALAIEKLSKKRIKFSKKKNKLYLLSGVFVLFLLGFFFEVPLRIVSSCEVISREPVIIAAPLEGVIKEILVEPGEVVKKGELLVDYEKISFEQDLSLARKEVELRQAEIGRTKTLGYNDEEKLSELKVIQAKNDQALAKLNFAQYQFDLSTVESPTDGIVSVENPEEWKGRPVSIGEKILTINKQGDTKVLIWIAEGDNVNLGIDIPVKIVLNVNPNTSYEARLDYISTISKINNENIVSFEAEGEWIDQPENIKIGQRGVAIMYGENVSLFYYLFRKPMLFMRRTFGF